MLDTIIMSNTNHSVQYYLKQPNNIGISLLSLGSKSTDVQSGIIFLMNNFICVRRFLVKTDRSSKKRFHVFFI